MGKDNRLWRKYVKKLRRQRKRRQLATCLDFEGSNNCEEPEKVDGNNEGQAGDNDLDRTFFLSKWEWEANEEEARVVNALKKVEEERLLAIEVADKRKIKEEWEAKLEWERKLKEAKDHLEKQMKEKQEAEFDQFLMFLSGDIETPPTKYLMPEEIVDEAEVCYYFAKTAACRFYDGCFKLHPRPVLSTAILIPNFFSHFKLEKMIRDEYDSDLGLEYEDKELYQEFLEFYEDVIPELRKMGKVIQFKVCCNLEPHLRGNVYVQYQTIQESVEAFRKFNGRFYNGKQLSLQFIKMDSWRSAICGAFLRKACVKGRTCKFLHVFRNPTKEFVEADHDWNWKPHQRSLAQNLRKVEPPLKNSESTNTNSIVLQVQGSSNGEQTEASVRSEQPSPLCHRKETHSSVRKTSTEDSLVEKRHSGHNKKAKRSKKDKSSDDTSHGFRSRSSKKSKHHKSKRQKEKKAKKHKKHSRKS